MKYSSITLALQELMDQITNKLPGVITVFDPNLSFDTSINRVRSNHGHQGNNANPSLPMLSWKRSPIRPTQELNNRQYNLCKNAAIGNLNREAGTVNTYSILSGEIDVDFMYFVEEMIDLEEFELKYTSGTGLTKLVKLTVDIPDPNINTLDFWLTWTMPLDDISMSIESTFYKAVSGKVTLKGMFISGNYNADIGGVPFSNPVTAPVITHINVDIKTSDNIISHTEITPND